MGTNEIQNFVIRIVKMLAQNCSYCVGKYPYHSCSMVLLCFLCLFFCSPFVVTLLGYCFPGIGLAFLVYRMFIATCRREVKNAGSRSKPLNRLRSRRTFRSVCRVHVPKQHNEGSFVQGPPGVRRNAREKSNNKVFSNMNAEGKDIFSTVKNDDLVEKGASVEEHAKGIREVMPVDCSRLDESYRKWNLDDHKVKKQMSLDDLGNKAAGLIDTDDEKRLMDLGISEVERTNRLKSLMERRRSRTLLKFQTIRNAMGVGIGNSSCGQISSLHIPKKNPFLSKNLGDLNSPLPGSAPTYMIKNNPFDLPYDPHEEKPILTGDSFKDEFMATHQKDPDFCRGGSSTLGDIAPSESSNDKHEMYFDTEFAIKQLRRLGASKVKLANKEDGNKQVQIKRLIPNVVTADNHAREEGESSVVNVADHTKEHEVDHTKQHEVDQTKLHEVDHTKEHKIEQDAVSTDHSTSSSCSSEDEPILKPNKEAILHCLSMSRMRVMSQGNSFRRNAESFDCGPSALFDKSKTDSFFFASNKRIHYGSTNSVASDMQVEVSELGSPHSTNISSLDGEGKRSLVNSTNPSEMDLNEMRLRDIDEVSEEGAFGSDLSESTRKPEKIDEDR